MDADWTAQASCARSYPDADWFADRTDNKRSKAAITVCRWCPVARECLELALKCENKSSDRQGIYGGLTPDDREALWPSGPEPRHHPGRNGVPDKNPFKRTEPGRNEAWLARFEAGETVISIAAEAGVAKSGVYRGLRIARGIQVA